MDPLSQGVLGSVAAQQLSKPQTLLAATFLGALSGMAPDLDVFIRSSSDPLLALEYHRQFTHSLFFIPFGGLLCALFFYPFSRRAGLNFVQTYCFCTLGYGTHGLLDACTTYGTQLLWPFSQIRVSWHTISIIDPLFTVPLLLLTIFACLWRSRRFAVIALAWVLLYSLFGVIQRERAEAFGWQLAKQRGHQPLKLEAKPSFANLLVWKVVYTTEDDFYVDAVRVGVDKQHYPGERIPRLVVKRDFPWLQADSQQAQDIERFRWFSNGYLAVSPEDSRRIIDVRYSSLPHQIKGLWGIEVRPGADLQEHVRYVTTRKGDRALMLGQLWSMVIGK